MEEIAVKEKRVEIRKSRFEICIDSHEGSRSHKDIVKIHRCDNKIAPSIKKGVTFHPLFIFCKILFVDNFNY